jgi:hypothetical protein
MPQPVHFSTRIPFSFAPEGLLERPELATQIAIISSLWNEIEARISAFLAALVGSESKTVIAVYLAIKNDGAKRATIDTITQQKLSATDFARFQEILRTIGSRYNDRNKVVHGAWAISPKYPGKLLWADVRETVSLMTEMIGLDHNETRRQEKLIAHQKQLMVYGLSDFKKIGSRMRTAYEELCAFTKPHMERGLGPLARVDQRPSPLRQAKPARPGRSARQSARRSSARPRVQIPDASEDDPFGE